MFISYFSEYEGSLELFHTRNGDVSPKTNRLRGEKRPIPDDQKDEKYFERRRRNNQAAKKSRDARKFREDQVNLNLAYRIIQLNL